MYPTFVYIFLSVVTIITVVILLNNENIFNAKMPKCQKMIICQFNMYIICHFV